MRGLRPHALLVHVVPIDSAIATLARLLGILMDFEHVMHPRVALRHATTGVTSLLDKLNNTYTYMDASPQETGPTQKKPKRKKKQQNGKQ